MITQIANAFSDSFLLTEESSAIVIIKNSSRPEFHFCGKFKDCIQTNGKFLQRLKE